MIKTVFKTNLDLIPQDKHWWPDQVPEVPRVGDFSRSAYVHEGRVVLVRDEPGGYRTVHMGKGFGLELVVVRVTWVTENKERWEVGRCIHAEVELHLPTGRWETLRTFYDYYEKVTGHKFL